MATLASLFRTEETPALTLAKAELTVKREAFEALPVVLQVTEIEAAERRWNYWLKETSS